MASFYEKLKLVTRSMTMTSLERSLWLVNYLIMLTASQANDNNNGGKLRESASLKCLSVNLGIIMQDFPLFR